MNITKPAALLLAASALVAGSTAAATAADPAGTRVTGLQRAADQVLADRHQPLSVSADAVRYEGLTVTEAPKTTSARDLACAYGHLCMIVKGTKFDFYKCQTWNVTNWTGDGPFTNNQTPGTVAKFFNKDGSVRWTSTAYQAGTATWDPIWSLRPC
ncbi:hypothetical protein [Streptomyces fumanus]|uniref:Secreted protein n=1 Tax=Streptomyces fumanus TaxID=67302 RepID=A0A919E4M6_9ACTN|nr:hypothetical protein [Streptomyces fumanus]GHF13369.1 hypothetical protein GCM10018772_43190 [Streptomyces fumanus]